MLRRVLLVVMMITMVPACGSSGSEPTKGKAVVSPSGFYEAQAIRLSPESWTIDIRAVDGTAQRLDLEPRFPLSRRFVVAWSPSNDVIFIGGLNTPSGRDDSPPGVIVLSDDGVWRPVEFEESCQYFTETDWPIAFGSSPFSCGRP